MPILQVFSPTEQDIFINTTWYKDTGEPILAAESMVGNIMGGTFKECLLENTPEETYNDKLSSTTQEVTLSPTHPSETEKVYQTTLISRNRFKLDDEGTS